MRLVYPITPELITLVCATCQGFEKALRRECDLSILQYRALSHLRQNGSCGETPLASALKANMSLLSRNLGELARRGCIDSEYIPKSGKSWSIAREGMHVLDEADIVLIGVYDSFFSGLDSQLHKSVKAGLRLTSQSQGHVRIKDGRFFDELAYFESVLAVEQMRVWAPEEREYNLRVAECFAKAITGR